MKTVVAVLLGVVSGLFLYLIVGMALVGPRHSTPPGATFALVALLGGSAGTWVYLLRGEQKLRGVLRRGFLLGAAEWVAMAAVGYFVALRNSASLIARSTFASAGDLAVATGAGHRMAALMALGSLGMAGVCWFCFTMAGPARRNAKIRAVPAPFHP